MNSTQDIGDISSTYADTNKNKDSRNMFFLPTSNIKNYIPDETCNEEIAEVNIQVVETVNLLIDTVSKKFSDLHPKNTLNSKQILRKRNSVTDSVCKERFNEDNFEDSSRKSNSKTKSSKQSLTRFKNIGNSSTITTTPPEFIAAHSREELHQILDEYFDKTRTQYIKHVNQRYPTDDSGIYFSQILAKNKEFLYTFSL